MINESAVVGLVGLGRIFGVLEFDGDDADALALGVVRHVDGLDGADGRYEEVLVRESAPVDVYRTANVP